MSLNVDQSFIVSFNSMAQHDLQRYPANLRNSVRTATDVVGHTYYWHIVGTGEATVNKPRHQDLSPMNVGHSQVSTVIQNLHAPELLDNFDTLKTNINLQQDYSKACANAIGRKLDDIIIAALATATTTITLPTATVLNQAGVTRVARTMQGASIPRGERYLLIDEFGLEDLMNENKATSTDFVNSKALETGFITGYHGFNITVIESEALPVATTGRFSFAYWKQAVGLAMASDMQMSVDKVPMKDGWLVLGKMSTGSSLILNGGVFKLDIVQS